MVAQVRFCWGLLTFATLTLCNPLPLWSQQEAAPPTAPASEKQETSAVDRRLQQRLGSPRKTMETFITAVNEDRKADAAECLDLSSLLTEEARSTKGPDYAFRLKAVIDRMTYVSYSAVETQAERDRFQLSDIARGMDDADFSDASQIVIAPDENGIWRFTAETVAAIDELFERWESRPEVEGLTAVNLATKTPSLWIRDWFPQSWRETHLLLPDYQWLCMLLVILVGFLADICVRAALNTITRAWFRFRRGEPTPELRRFWKPVGLFVQALVWYGGTRLIGLPDFALDVLLIGLKFFAVIAAVWMAFHFVDLVASVLSRKAQTTGTKYDDLLIPLISRSLKVFSCCVGVLVMADAFNLKVTGLLAGLGIGGMAIAFAAKDAISNLFGSVTVLLDRPFEVGDWIITEGVEGTVETVGFRSTRIRTFYNSSITLPNSVLTTAVVDNMGRRRFRRIKALLGVQYDTNPEQIDAFCEGIRELIRRHPYTRKDYYHVYLNQFSGSSLDILLYCFVECPDWSVELREKHRLFSDILKLARQLGVSFAFPTQTLHMFQESAPEPMDMSTLGPPELAGQRAAARVAGNPLGPDERPGGVLFSGPSLVDENGSEE